MNHVIAAAQTGSPVPGAIIILLAIAAYWTPSIVAGIRKVPHAGSVIVVNLFLGWTVIGWIVALAMACRSRTLAVSAGTTLRDPRAAGPVPGAPPTP